MKMPRIVHVEPPEGPSEYARLRARVAEADRLLRLWIDFYDCRDSAEDDPKPEELCALTEQWRDASTVSGSPE